jgi:hypothetical protein
MLYKYSQSNFLFVHLSTSRRKFKIGPMEHHILFNELLLKHLKSLIVFKQFEKIIMLIFQ